DKLQALRMPILVGISRKSMIYKRFGITPEESLPATQVAHYMALQRGATYLRVHDVAEARRTIAIFEG
ncbi:MAG: dihydropteroate synthase, partial [Bacteroidales bacterium]|nr:dihydropteroate synthase [Bacteroidales bacterium]